MADYSRIVTMYAFPYFERGDFNPAKCTPWYRPTSSSCPPHTSYPITFLKCRPFISRYSIHHVVEGKEIACYPFPRRIHKDSVRKQTHSSKTKCSQSGETLTYPSFLGLSLLAWNRKPIDDLIAVAQQKYYEKDALNTIVYIHDAYVLDIIAFSASLIRISFFRNGSWSRTTPRASRPLSSIILEPELLEMLVADAKRYLAGQKWYIERSVPFQVLY